MNQMCVFVKFERDEEPRACRICLDTGVPLFGLMERGICDNFAEFTGFTISTTDGLPQLICAVCYAQLRKSSRFRAKCRSTQIFLQNERSRLQTLTTEYIRNLDTSHLKLPLAVTDIETINLPEISTDETITINVKKESTIVHNKNNKTVACKEIDIVAIDNDVSIDDSDFEINDDASFDEQPMDVNDSTKEEIFVKEEVVEIKETTKKVVKTKRDSSETKKLRKRLLKYSKETRDAYKKLFYDYVLEKYVNKTRDNVNENLIDILDSDNEVKVDDNIFDLNDTETNRNKKLFYKYVQEKYVNKKTEDELKDIVRKTKTRIKKNVKDKRYKDENEIIAFAKTYNFDVVFLNKEEQVVELQARKQSQKYKKGTYRCELCFFGFQTETVFKKHMAVHDPSSGDEICAVCHMRFQRNTEMMEHHRRHHMLKYTCRECGKCVTYSSLAKQHYEFHKGVKYECEHCGKKYSKYASRMDHIRIHHGSTVCDICYDTFQGPLGLKAHKTKAHRETVQCASCSAHFDNKDALKRHIGAPGAACAPHVKPCTKCGYNFSSTELLDEHISLAHNKQKPTADAGYTLKKFQSKNKQKLCTCSDNDDPDPKHPTKPDSLNESHFGSTNETYKTIEPTDYGSGPSNETDKYEQFGSINDDKFRFGSNNTKIGSINEKYQYGSNDNRIDSINEDKGSIDDKFGFGSRDRIGSIDDDKYGSINEEYGSIGSSITINRDVDKCKKCGGRKRRPRKPKNFLCEICADRRFTSEAALKYHQRIHTGERPFQCPVCPKRFRVKENLHNHVNTHTGERPYPCAHCPKAFRTNTAKHRHQLVHTKKRPFRCDICDKTFQTSTYLKVHVRTVHMKIPMPPRVRNRRRHME